MWGSLFRKGLYVVHCTGIFADNCLIVVITKFDLVRVSQSEDYTEEETSEDVTEEITEDKVKEATCLFVSNACDGAKISPANVIPVSGRWAYHARMLAYHARMLAGSHPESKNHKKCRQTVVKCLQSDEVCDLTCGQGEELSTSLFKLEDHELSAKLEELSGIANLEVRYIFLNIYLLSKLTLHVTARVVSVSRLTFNILALTRYASHDGLCLADVWAGMLHFSTPDTKAYM